MEESEKRKERLRAMRMDAEVGLSLNPRSPLTPPPAQLSNPLANPFLPPPPRAAAESTPPPPRFDFYTDPMSAFSNSKRRSSDNFSSPIRSASPITHPSSNYNQHSGGPRNYDMSTPSPAHQFPMNHSPDPCGSWISPIRFVSPFSGPIANPVAHPGVLNPSPACYSGGAPSGHSYHPNSQWSSFSIPSFGQEGSPMSNTWRGSPNSFSGSGSGRGRGRERDWRGSSSPGLGWSSGRGRGPSACIGTGQFYSKAMVQDPWRDLKPTLGNILVPLAGPTSWLPKSLTAKKPKKVDGSGIGIGSNAKLNLAEYLASSIAEAVNEADA